ncbi:MAG TPA: hypothetical protein VGR31_16090 [Planctomycetota bacterium]|jgi:tetratricopeptide (TPR) repeat protein|nr:hypothetical protein [Planctomycetota bacterium]
MRGSGLAAPFGPFSVVVESFPGRTPGHEGGESLNYRRSRVNGARALARTGLCVLFALASARPGVSQEKGPDAGSFGPRLALLGADDAAGRAALDALTKSGEPAALAALAELARHGADTPSSLARRRCARLVFAAGGPGSIQPAIAASRDADAGVRAEILAFLGRDDLGEAGLAERVRTIAERAVSDPDRELRSRALRLLAGLDRPESLAALDALLATVDEPARAEAALLLADRPRARELVEKRVAAGDPAVLAPLLAALGRDLGDRADASRAAPILRALRHPDPRVRRGAQIGVDAFVRRLFAGADAARAVRAITELEDLGLDRTQAAMLRARAVLVLGADPRAALVAAAELGRAAAVSADEDARSTLAAARHLEAAAQLALGAPAEAARPLADEAALLDGLLAERIDRGGKALASLHATRLHRRAECEVFVLVQALALDGKPDAPESSELVARCVRAARRAHALELEAQVAEIVADASGRASLDAMLEDALAPDALFLENPRLAAWPGPRALWIRREIGRAFTSVAPDEMPGFEPFPDVPAVSADPLQDPERLALLKGILRARIDSVAARLQELRGSVRGRMADDPTAPSDADEERMQYALRDWEELLEASQKASTGEPRVLLESRAPSLLALALARAFREEGDAVQARALAEKVKADLDRSGDLKRFLLVEAEIEMTIGSSWIDAGDPARAEIELARAAERLESIESSLRERGSPPRDLAVVRGLRASALVSLAVNANVKMHDQKKALAYFERAFELRQDEFMRVLLACYRARSGRGDEARAILREISPSPANLYNVACTWALLGERELALECLKRDLEENPMSAGMRDKQREWARTDPDLASVRDDPRFRALVGP